MVTVAGKPQHVAACRNPRGATRSHRMGKIARKPRRLDRRSCLPTGCCARQTAPIPRFAGTVSPEFGQPRMMRGLASGAHLYSIRSRLPSSAAPIVRLLSKGDPHGRCRPQDQRRGHHPALQLGPRRYRRWVPWGSTSRSGSTTAACTPIDWPGSGQALEKSDLGALLVFDVNNIRYITSTKIGEWERDKLCRWGLLTRDGEPILWDFGSAAVHHKLFVPWLKPENCKAGLIGLRGTVSPSFGLMKRHAEEIAALIREAGCETRCRSGSTYIEPPMMFELEKAGLKVADGQQVMLEAREIKNIDEIALLNRSAAMVDGAYHLIHEELKPGVRENDIVAKVKRVPLPHGSTTSRRSMPSRRALQIRTRTISPTACCGPGTRPSSTSCSRSWAYRTCYYRTFNVGRATPVQHDAYKKAREWLDRAIA